jgi:nickel-dependent lactate racemase
MKKVQLAYGKSAIEISVPEDAVVIEPRELKGLDDERGDVVKAMRHPNGTPPLRQMVKSSDRVAIVISDLTRPLPSHKLVPWIVEELGHVPKDNFVVINGLGSHRANTKEELISMLGQKVVDTVKIENHDSFNGDRLVRVGRNSYGSEVFLNKTYVESTFKIVTGFIEPHLYAGFSGGPKGINPGIAGIETILDFHNAFMIGHPKSTWGVLDGNVVQDAATQNCLMAKPDFMLNVTLNGKKEITNVFAGDVIAAHRVGCQFVKENSMYGVPRPYEIVVTTNSGYPLDQNLYQTVKGMSAAAMIVRQGGAILSASECSDGVPDHGNFGELMQRRDTAQALLDMIEEPSFRVFDQWAVQSLASIQVKANCYLYSSLSDETARRAKYTPIHNVQEKLFELIRENPNARVAVLPLGSLTIPYVLEKGAAEPSKSSAAGLA